MKGDSDSLPGVRTLVAQLGNARIRNTAPFQAIYRAHRLRWFVC
jgi:hypothetical protein